MSNDDPSLLTTFLGPFGISSGPEEYQRRQHEFLDGLQDISNIARLPSWGTNSLKTEGVEPDQPKGETIREMPIPPDKAAAQRFLSMCQYLSKCCSNLLETVPPLRDLTKQDAVFYGMTRMETLSIKQRNSFHQLLPCDTTDGSSSPVTLQVEAFLQDNQPVRKVLRRIFLTPRKETMLKSKRNASQ